MNEKKWNAWKTLWFTVKIAPMSFAVMLLVGLLDSAIAVMGVYLTGRVFERVELCMGGAKLSSMVGVLALFCLYQILAAVHNNWYTRYYVQFRDITRFEGRVLNMLHQKSQRISNEQLEMPRAYAFIRQSSNARQLLFRFVEICIDVVTAAIQTVVVTAYASTFHGWYGVFLPMAAVSPFIGLVYQAKLWKKDYERATQLEREEEEYIKAMTDETACKESRLTGADRLLYGKWEESRGERDRLEERKSCKMFGLRSGLEVFNTAGAIAGFVISVVLYRSGQLSLAGFTAGVAAYTSLVNNYRMLMQMLGEYSRYLQMTKPFFRYWNFGERDEGQNNWEEMADKETENGNGGKSFDFEIELRDVSFTYPNQEIPALEQINLKLRRGEILAVVGENGAGKTTLTNLLLGLYRPSSGCVLYDGKDISKIKEISLHRHQSAVFQNFNRYKMTVGENIAIADVGKENEEKILGEISELFPGEDAGAVRDRMLGREFGGAELSGGQWQRLACARGFYKDRDFVALDEATSAIDPLKEKELYDRFRQEMKGKTGIIVTHRLGAVSLADRIVVLSKGKICEEGTRLELLEKDGLYARLWREQTGSYGSAGD